MGLPGIFVVFALIALLLEVMAPRFHGVLDTLLAFYCFYALGAGGIEIRLMLKARAATGGKHP